MLEFKSIEKFLANNSSMNPQSVMGKVVQADMQSRYRPDKLFLRDAYMKWDMVYNGIDSPHRMANNATFARLDRNWIATEVNDLKDFKI